MASMQAMMYGSAAQQGQDGQQPQEGAQQPDQQGQQPNMQGFPGFFPGAMPNYFQSQAAAAHAAAAMAEQRLSGMTDQGGYGSGYGGGYAGGYPGYGAGDNSHDYMEANRLLMARLHQQQGGAPGGWMPMQYGYGMPSPQQDAYAESGMLGPWSTTSAGLLGRIGGTEDKKKSVRRKHKDKPKRPLSAYNLFFKDERTNILAEITAAKGSEGEEEVKKESSEEGGDDDDEEKTKRHKRKKPPHGKIGFESLAKTIGQRWQKLEGDRLENYKKLAAEDMTRYKKEMEVFLTKLEIEKKKQEGGEDVGEEDENGVPVAKKLKTEEEPEESQV
jgi:hypothetical protein